MSLRALFDLAERTQEGPISIRELAERNDVPRRFLEQIMLELKAKGWVTSVAGRDGGFELAISPEKLSMGRVAARFDGLLARLAVVSVTNYEACSAGVALSISTCPAGSQKFHDAVDGKGFPGECYDRPTRATRGSLSDGIHRGRRNLAADVRAFL